MDQQRSIIAILKLRCANGLRIKLQQDETPRFGLVVVLGPQSDVLSIEIGLLSDWPQMARRQGRALGRRRGRARRQHLIQHRATFLGFRAHAGTLSRTGEESVTDGCVPWPLFRAPRINSSTSPFTLFMASIARSNVRRSPSYSATS